MMNNIKIALHSYLVAWLTAVSTSLVGAQEAWPSKSIRLIVPYPAGAGTDAVARLIGTKLSTALGQAVVVENRAGANTIIGTDLVARATPDGYTFGLVTDSHSINPNFQKLPYDTPTAFTPVSQLASVPFAFVVSASSLFNNLSQLIAAAKASPGKLSYASLGEGSPHYIAMEWLKLLSGTEMIHIPYKGAGQALADVMGGQINVMFAGLASAVPQVKAGRLNALAVSSSRRHAALSNVPPVSETTGLGEFEYRSWYGIVAPAGLPHPIANRMSSELQKALSDPEVVAKFETLGVDPASSTPAQFTKFLQEDAARYTKIIRATGVKGGN